MYQAFCSLSGLLSSSIVHLRRFFPVALSLLFAGLLAAGCGTGHSSSSGPAPTQAVVIDKQPASQSVPIGRPATFTVSANGTLPLSYEWSKNGVEIGGATEASYTTPDVALGDSGSTYQVTVTNVSSSATSNIATLTAGPRAPKLGDLRYLLYQQVVLPWTDPPGQSIHLGGQTGEVSANNALGAPLGMGSTQLCTASPPIPGCQWPSSALFLPPPMTGLSMYYQQDLTGYQSYSSFLQSIAAPNVVITSMDLELNGDVIGVSYVKTVQAGGFDSRLEVVPRDEIQATATQDGTESRIITAVTFDSSGQAIMISYGWQSDTITNYETQTVVAKPQDVLQQATSLANEGYVISAFGGNDTNGYILVGTRVQGDSLPRPIFVTIGSDSTVPPKNPDSAYTTVVLSLYELDGSTLIQEQ